MFKDRAYITAIYRLKQYQLPALPPPPPRPGGGGGHLGI